MGQTCLHRFDLIIGYHSIITYISQSDIVLLEHDIRTTICNLYVTEFDTKRLPREIFKTGIWGIYLRNEYEYLITSAS
jgi:hypothetical protein